MLTEAMNIRVLTDFPWILSSGILIFLTVICFNVTGDFLRDRYSKAV